MKSYLDLAGVDTMQLVTVAQFYLEGPALKSWSNRQRSLQNGASSWDVFAHTLTKAFADPYAAQKARTALLTATFPANANSSSV